MRTRRSHRVGLCPLPAAFTLIELLVVLAIVSVLLAISLQVLHRARTLTLICRTRLQTHVQVMRFVWPCVCTDPQRPGIAKRHSR